jgi:hypothetical protein
MLYLENQGPAFYLDVTYKFMKNPNNDLRQDIALKSQIYIIDLCLLVCWFFHKDT